MKRVSSIALLCLGLAVPIQLAPISAQEDDSQRAFSIPERTEALRRAREVESHLAAQRWPQAVQTLQDMLEHDGDAVLPSSYRSDPLAPSAHPVFPGAGEWARTKLRAMPGDGVKVYRQRFGAAADDALANARKSQDQNELVATAARWPLCDAAPRALFILGEIELEAGHADMALLAWREAVAAFRLIEPKLDGKPNPRIGALLERCDVLSTRLLAEREARGLSLPDNPKERASFDPLSTGDLSQARTPVPSRSADNWYTFLNMWPFSSSGNSKVLYPTVHRGRVLVSNSLELFCLDPFTGRELWRSEPPWGWNLLKDAEKSDLITGLYPEMLHVQPVASGRVAVVPLQLPYSALPNRYFREITVMKAIPQRRLFAFDLLTGAPLWDHAPELEVVGRGSSLAPKRIDGYAESMMIAATPVIVGSRLLVPSYILEGRIDYQVACYELESGRLLWKTNLISGQRSRNMFGRAMREFCSSPLVVEGQRVIAQTDLGSVAALDLNTGAILWESLYRQIPQPKNRGFSERSRDLTWLTSRPVVIDQYVISAPADSMELYCYNLEDGRVLWSFSERELSSGSSGRDNFDRLLGADENSIYLGGSQIAALRKPGGFGSSLPFKTSWSAKVQSARSLPPQLLCKEGILVPMADQRVLFSRRDGHEVESLSGPWDYPGTPEVSDGIMITLGRDGLRGYFDWPSLLDKQKREYRNNPNNYEIGLASAQLFTRRAQAGLLKNDLFVSLEYLKDARAILERMAEGGALDTRTGSLLHQVLCSEAEALERKGDSSTALLRLKRARQLAPHARALRDTMLQEERILRVASGRKAYLSILADLESECAAQPLPEEYLPEFRALFEFDELFDGQKPSIALWVLLQRAEEHITAANLAQAFGDWSQVLIRFGDFQLQGQSAGELVNRRLGHQLKLPGGRKAYAAFENRAQALLAAAAKNKDLLALDYLTEAYPHSIAAARSDQIQIEWAYEQGDRQRLANIVHGPRAMELEDQGRPAFLRLAQLLGRAGNQAYERAMLRKLAADNPGAVSDLPGHYGRTLQSVLDDLLAQVPAQADNTPNFHGEIGSRRGEPGNFSFLGSMHGRPEQDGSSAELHIYATSTEPRTSEPRSEPSRPSELGIERPIHLVSFSDGNREREHWRIIVQDEFFSQSSPWNACATTPERALVGGRLAIHAYDPDGQLVWEHPRREEQLKGRFLTRSLHQKDGILIAWMQHREDDQSFIARAFDVHLGTLLWESPLQKKGRRWYAPVVGSEHVVFLSKPYRKTAVAHVIEILSGRSVGEFELGEIDGPFERASWIHQGRLMVPHFRTGNDTKERIAVHDLLSGRELWFQSLPAGEELRNIVLLGDEIFVVMFTSETINSGGVYHFKPESRSLRRILPLRPGERPLGINNRDLVQLESPELLLYNTDSASNLRIRALDLEQARATWTRALMLEANQTFLPVMSEDQVAIVVSSRAVRKKVASLFLLDRKTGAQNLRVELSDNICQANDLKIRGLGESIYIAGSGTVPKSRYLEIINTTEESR